MDNLIDCDCEDEETTALAPGVSSWRVQQWVARGARLETRPQTRRSLALVRGIMLSELCLNLDDPFLQIHESTASFFILSVVAKTQSQQVRKRGTSSFSCGRALRAGKEPTMPALHWAITSAGLETMKRGAPITGRRSFEAMAAVAALISAGAWRTHARWGVCTSPYRSVPVLEQTVPAKFLPSHLSTCL